jgi:roadblock/LC7 domain-containing protein
VAQEDSCREEPMQLAMLYGMFGSAAPVGPNAWFYSCTATPLVEPTWTGNSSGAPNTYAYCSQITLAAGNITKFSVYAGETYAETSTLALYDTSGNQLSGSCTTETYASAWMDCTISSPYAVAAGDYYLCLMNSVNSFIVKYLNVSSTQQSTLSYASFPYATLTLSEFPAQCDAVRVFVQ